MENELEEVESVGFIFLWISLSLMCSRMGNPVSAVGVGSGNEARDRGRLPSGQPFESDPSFFLLLVPGQPLVLMMLTGTNLKAVWMLLFMPGTFANDVSWPVLEMEGLRFSQGHLNM